MGDLPCGECVRGFVFGVCGGECGGSRVEVVVGSCRCSGCVVVGVGEVNPENREKEVVAVVVVVVNV